MFRPATATLDLPGLPHSATGQAALITGKNAASVMGRHYGPWPGPTLKTFLTDTATVFDYAPFQFANAYPDGYFASLTKGTFQRNSLAFAASLRGQPGFTEQEYQAGRGLAVDFRGERLGAATTPELEACRAAALLADTPFVFMDYWITDTFGHQQNHAASQAWFRSFDTFVKHTRTHVSDALIIITSDHGNTEDHTHKRHTRNRVPFIALGPGAQRFENVTSLLDVAPALHALYHAAQ